MKTKSILILALMLISAALAPFALADNNPVGTWQGFDDVGDTIDIVLYSDGTIEGTWEKYLG